MPNKLPANLSGIVKRYKGNGRKFGYPTANIDVSADLDDGVYFGFADLGAYRHQPAVIFIGTPTTVGDSERRVEAYLFDIEDKDYYDQQLNLELRIYHRANQTFSSIDKLLATMRKDEQAARHYFARLS